MSKLNQRKVLLLVDNQVLDGQLSFTVTLNRVEVVCYADSSDKILKELFAAKRGTTFNVKDSEGLFNWTAEVDKIFASVDNVDDLVKAIIGFNKI